MHVILNKFLVLPFPDFLKHLTVSIWVKLFVVNVEKRTPVKLGVTLMSDPVNLKVCRFGDTFVCGS